MYDIFGVLSDLFSNLFEPPFFTVICFGFLIPVTFSISYQLFRIICGLNCRRRPAKEIEVPARVSREILISESSGIIEGCADCPLCKSSGLRDEQCKLHGTAFCCIGRKLTDKGGVSYE